jgi:ADP-heptose:LPS heptosyltransferase
MWPPERFVAVLDAFLDHHPDFIALLVGGRPQPLDRGRNAERVMPCYGIPLDVSLGLVQSADLFLGIDSSMLHAADFFRIPSVGLFGASNPVEFGFRVTPAAALCRGRSMDAIGIGPVIEALERLAMGATAAGMRVGV